jgi:hypothetical protein
MTKAVLALISLLALASAGCIVAGVYLLAGPGWALISGGLVFSAAAFILLRGLINV